ncbi:MAG: primosomal replication protein N [Burkholderiales bacterium]
MENNHLEFSGILEELTALRYTPAGVPLIECKISHRSRQLESGGEREVILTLPAIAIGEIAQRLQRLNVTQAISASGFLARKSRNSPHIVLHICSLENIQTGAQ